MRIRLLPVAALALVLGLVPTAARAFELNPISREFTPAGSGSTQSYEVVNKDKDPIAINVTVVTRALDVVGVESNQAADDDFLVYPPQFILEPGARQTIRVTWLGDPAPQRELAYRLVVEQLPIERFKPVPKNKAPAKGAFQVLTRYMGSLYIRPAQVQAKLAVESARIERDAAKPAQLAVMVHNRGTARAVLKDYTVQVKGRGAEPAVSLSPSALELKSSVVLPDGKRKLVFPWPQGFEPGEVTVQTGH